MNFYEKFFALDPGARRRIADDAGMSLAYIHKHTYTSQDRDPKFKMENAVRLDRASGGAIPFWKTTEGEVDWDYVLERLKWAKRKGEIKSAKPEEVV